MKGKCYSKVNMGQRNKVDDYKTPYSLTELLLEQEFFDPGKTVLEPAAGDGAIIAVLNTHFDDELANVDYYDLYSPDVHINKDFLKEEKKYDYIITNPPFSLAKEFIVHAKKIVKDKFAFLLKFDFLSGQWRYENIFQDTKYPLTKIYLFTRMPMLDSNPIRPDGKFKTGMQTYAWLIWENKPVEKILPVLNWLDCDKYVLRRCDEYDGKKTKEKI